MTILSYETIFGLTFSAISENLLESFFRNVPKTVILAIFGTFGQNRLKWVFYKKSGRAIFLTLIVPRLHTKFQKNRSSGFRDQFVTDGHTDKGDLIEPVAFAGSISTSLSTTEPQIG